MSVVQLYIQIRTSSLLLLVFMTIGSREKLKAETTGPQLSLQLCPVTLWNNELPQSPDFSLTAVRAASQDTACGLQRVCLSQYHAVKSVVCIFTEHKLSLYMAQALCAVKRRRGEMKFAPPARDQAVRVLKRAVVTPSKPHVHNPTADTLHGSWPWHESFCSALVRGVRVSTWMRLAFSHWLCSLNVNFSKAHGSHPYASRGGSWCLWPGAGQLSPGTGVIGNRQKTVLAFHRAAKVTLMEANL